MQRLCKLLSKVKWFATEVAKEMWNQIWRMIQNLDGIAILVLATVGASTLLLMLPYTFALPMWMEAKMVAVVVASFGVYALASIPARSSHVTQ